MELSTVARVRRSAGTFSSLGRALLRRSTPLDLDAYRNGTGFKVMSMLRPVKDIGNPRTLTRGVLTLVPGEPITWKGGNSVQVLTGPFQLNDTGAKVPMAASFGKFLLSTEHQDYELTMPKLDQDLVRLAMDIEA
jgi:hypothetical protein